MLVLSSRASSTSLAAAGLFVVLLVGVFPVRVCS